MEEERRKEKGRKMREEEKAGRWQAKRKEDGERWEERWGRRIS